MFCYSKIGYYLNQNVVQCFGCSIFLPPKTIKAMFWVYLSFFNWKISNKNKTSIKWYTRRV